MAPEAPERPLSARPPGPSHICRADRNPCRRPPPEPPAGCCNPRRRGHAVAPAGCSPRRRAHAEVLAGCSSRCRGHAVAPAGCSLRCRGHAVAPADCSLRCRGPAAASADGSPSQPVHAVGRQYGSRSSHGLPGPNPPQAAVVAPQSGDLPPRRPCRPPKHVSAPPDAHTLSCRLAGPYLSPDGNLPADPRIPRDPKSSEAGTAAPLLTRGHPGSRHPDAPAHTPSDGHRQHRCPKNAVAGPPTPRPPRYPKAAGADKAAPRPPHCPNHGGLDKAAHRPPHARPGQSHHPGPARAPNPSARPPDAHSLDAQRRHRAGPATQIVPGPRLHPGRQCPGRNHVPPNPSHADRTSRLPRLPPPLPSGPSTYSAQCR